MTMAATNRRRPPPLWILLDILTLCVLVMVSLPPPAEGGLRYEFLGLPADSVLFAVKLPLQSERSRWTHYSFDTHEWVTGTSITPHGLKNFLCDECALFLPTAVPAGTTVMIGMPSAIRTRIHKAFFDACTHGDCAPTLYINARGDVTFDPHAQSRKG